MKPHVYFASSRGNEAASLIDKITGLFTAASLEQRIGKSHRVAVKVHFGEPGNTAFVRPPFVRAVVECIKNAGGDPFVTDANTIYAGFRHNAIRHLETAEKHGFTLSALGAPVLIADGLTGLDFTPVDVPGEYIKEAKIASAISQAQDMVVLSHVKGHMLFGFGGAIKSLGMGCSCAPGKQTIHSDVKPKVKAKKCTGCGECVTHCLVQAIRLLDVKEKKMAFISHDICTGCGECISVCPERAIPVNWATADEPLQKKTVEYAFAAIKNKRERVAFINFLINITPDCDCCNWTDTPIVPDIGFLASYDPVAIDKASIDLVNQAPVTPGCVLDKGGPVDDKFQAIKGVRYDLTFEYAEKLGLGSREYTLIKVD